MSLNMMTRGSRTLLVGIGLACIYLVYSQAVRVGLTVEHRDVLPQVRRDKPEEKSRVFDDLASKYLREDSWVQSANGRFRDGNRLLFFEEHELFNDNRSIRVKPVALLWQNTRDELPITATADSAQLDASTKFSFSEGQFGRITSGLLSGVVRITGPDGLRIEGRTFYISDDAMKIWTRQRVSFAWQNHRGYAEDGAEIELVGSDDPEKNGLMSVSDVARIRLRGRVQCELLFLDEDGKDDPVPLTINAANGFEYFVPTRQATFYGILEKAANEAADVRGINAQTQVLVERPVSDGTTDRLVCSKLTLQLQPRVRTVEKKDSSESLELASITAEGRRVLLRSDSEQVRASMKLLRFWIQERTLEMLGGEDASSGKPVMVQVRQRGHQLTTPRLVVSLDAENQFRQMECAGPGTIMPVSPDGSTTPDPEEHRIQTAWAHRLLMLRGEQDRVVLEEKASVKYEQQQFSLSGDRIEMTLDTPTTAGQSEKAGENDDREFGIDASHLQPRLLTATGNVSMNSVELDGEVREKLTVQFRGETEPNALQNASLSESEDPVVRSVSDSDETTNRLNGTTHFVADQLDAVLQSKPGQSHQLEDLWLKGNVTVDHTARENGESFSAAGHVLHAAGGFGGNREINLSGAPASVVRGSARIEGQRIDLTEISKGQEPEREARVESSGRIRFVIHQGPDGRPLAKPAPLDIYWNERMILKGRVAHFIGNVRAVLDNDTDYDAELTCAGMTVTFADDVQIEATDTAQEFRVAPSESAGISEEIEQIECEGRVVVNLVTMIAGVVTARHHAEFADFVIHQMTGEFHAVGPGFVESVQPDKDKRLTVSGRAVGRANTPVSTPDHSCLYLRATFIGALEGNHQSRFVRLRQHVRGVFGPVRTLDDRISIDGMSVHELPDQTGSMGCENLTVSAVPAVGDQPESFSLVAESNVSGSTGGTRAPCRLESRQFSGDADRITYDHAKQQYILRADDGRQAKVTYQPDGGEPQTLTGRRFDYYADRNQLHADQITGVQATDGL